MEVNFRPIERSNVYKCMKLKVSAEQRKFVASNEYSLVQAAYEPDTYPLAIYLDDEMVGFIMYDYDSDSGIWEMSRLMVDEKYQGRGLGTAAVGKFLEFLTNELGHIMFYTSAEPMNKVAIGLYEKAGFKLNGKILYGEVQMEIQL